MMEPPSDTSLSDKAYDKLQKEITLAVSSGHNMALCEAYEKVLKKKQEEIENLQAYNMNQQNALKNLQNSMIELKQQEQLDKFSAAPSSSSTSVTPVTKNTVQNTSQKENQQFNGQNINSSKSPAINPLYNPSKKNVDTNNSSTTEGQVLDSTKAPNLRTSTGEPVTMVPYRTWVKNNNVNSRYKTPRGYRGGNKAKRAYFANKFDNKRATSTTFTNVASYHIALANEAAKVNQSWKKKEHR